MIKEIKLPDLGEGIDGAEVSEVKVSVGDLITADKTILVLESDKASMEIPSEVNGKVNSIFVEVGNEIKTGQKLISVELDDKSEKTAVVPEFKNQKEAAKELKINPQPSTPGSPERRCPSIEKLINDTKYKQQFSLNQGLIETFNWYERNIFSGKEQSAK